MSENQTPELTPKYYRDNFNYLLDFVVDKYKEILQENEWRFLRKYNALNEDAQCLFIRFANRKGLFFKTAKLSYAEIENIDEQLQILIEKGFIEPLTRLHTAYFQDICKLATKTELLKITQTPGIKSASKEKVIEHIASELKAEEFIEKYSLTTEAIKVNFEYEVTFLKFLFFGNRYMDMSEFVVRDLGLIQYYQHDDDKLVARFETRKDAEEKWMISDQSEIFEQLKKEASGAEIYNWFLTLNDAIKDLSEVAKPSLERLKLKTARHLERLNLLEEAITIYALCNIPQANERRIRCLFKLGQKEETLALCDHLIEHSTNEEERLFAKDFSDRVRSKNTREKKLTTKKLHEAERITIPAMYRGQVELGTIAHYINEGKYAIFAENHLWRGIFGLTFWDIIFDPSLVSFHHPFQRRPSDLHLPDFYEKRKEQIHELLESFTSTEELTYFMGNNYIKHLNLANPFVIWVEGMWESIKIATQFIPLSTLKEILLHISKDITENSRGFPDLFVWDEQDYEFIEVKSPTDSLSNRQLYWLGYFEEKGVNARVLRVYFDD